MSVHVCVRACQCGCNNVGLCECASVSASVCTCVLAYMCQGAFVCECFHESVRKREPWRVLMGSLGGETRIRYRSLAESHGS